MSGRYESYYLRAVDPDAPRGVWIRHTVLERPGAAPAGSLWCTVWDAAAGSPVAVKETPGLAQRGDWLEIGDRKSTRLNSSHSSPSRMPSSA